MKKIIVILLLVCALCGHIGAKAGSLKTFADTIPVMLQGNFMDDYGIRYTITDSLWIQLPQTKYHIISWDIKEQYLLARNDDDNPGDQGLYTRIDYMNFSHMQPYHWGFCLTVYNAGTVEEARAKAQADPANPKKGCAGYPFSRMKRTD